MVTSGYEPPATFNQVQSLANTSAHRFRFYALDQFELACLTDNIKRHRFSKCLGLEECFTLESVERTAHKEAHFRIQDGYFALSRDVAWNVRGRPNQTFQHLGVAYFGHGNDDQSSRFKSANLVAMSPTMNLWKRKLLPFVATAAHLARRELIADDKIPVKGMIEDLGSRDSDHLPRATSEALAFIGYVKRFATKESEQKD